jgi:hypothetical protein
METAAPVMNIVSTMPQDDLGFSVNQSPSILERFIQIQPLNTRRHLMALRPFQRQEFGKGSAAPSEAHIQAANALISHLRKGLSRLGNKVEETSQVASSDQSSLQQYQAMLVSKEQAGHAVKYIEKIWSFFFSMFSQRQSQFADWLLASDRIALDCYQAVYTGLGRARSIPTPPPLALIETEATPSTFRRGVRLSRLGQLQNPFPIVQLPYHRLVNPWTLGAIHHEVSHNIQSDLNLWQEVPRRIRARLTQFGIDQLTSRTWARWHKEIWADLSGLLLGGPACVASLMDVVGGSAQATMAFSPAGVHPTPYLRVFISLELLKRMSFPQEAAQFHQLWAAMYPSPQRSNIPRLILDSFSQANQLVVDTICFQPYTQLGGKSLANVIGFKHGHQQMIQEAATRLATGTDPGILPARYLVGATRWAVDHRLASPEQITRNFYQALANR